MFIAHFGVAMAAQKVAPGPSLGTLVLAALLVDGVWPLFLLLGWLFVAWAYWIGRYPAPAARAA